MGDYTLDDLGALLETELKDIIPAGRRSAVAEEVAKGVVAEHYDEISKRRIDPDLFNRNRHYAIPDDKLELIPSLIRSALSVFTDGPLSALTEVVGLLLRYRQLRIEIDADEVLVLKELKTAKDLRRGGLTPSELAENMVEYGDYSIDRVRELLGSLLDKGERGGPDVTLVRVDDERWRMGNV